MCWHLVLGNKATQVEMVKRSVHKHSFNVAGNLITFSIVNAQISAILSKFIF